MQALTAASSLFATSPNWSANTLHGLSANLSGARLGYCWPWKSGMCTISGTHIRTYSKMTWRHERDPRSAVSSDTTLSPRIAAA